MGPRDQKQGQLGAGEGGKVGGKVPALQRKRRNPLKVSGGRGRFIMVTLKPVGQPSEFQDTRGQEIETETKNRDRDRERPCLKNQNAKQSHVCIPGKWKSFSEPESSRSSERLS